MLPLVSVITPTTHDREEFNKRIELIFDSQDYPEKEHIINYSASQPLGQKMNETIAKARGTIILNMDSDDTFAPDWITRCVSKLIRNKNEVVGLRTAYFFNPVTKELYYYSYPETENHYHGGTMCHTKDFWLRNPYRALPMGYDYYFTDGAKSIDVDYSEGFIATLHPGNTSPKNLNDDRWKKVENTPNHLHRLLTLYPPLPLL